MIKKNLIKASLAVLAISQAAKAETITVKGGYTPGYSGEYVANILLVEPLPSAWGDHGPLTKLLVNYDKTTGSSNVILKNVEKISDDIKEYRVDINASCQEFSISKVNSDIVFSKKVKNDFKKIGMNKKEINKMLRDSSTVFRAQCTDPKIGEFGVYVNTYADGDNYAIISRNQVSEGEDGGTEEVYDLLISDNTRQ